MMNLFKEIKTYLRAALANFSSILIIRVKGGIGNQCFYFAEALYQRIVFNKKVYLDYSYYRYYSDREPIIRPSYPKIQELPLITFVTHLVINLILRFFSLPTYIERDFPINILKLYQAKGTIREALADCNLTFETQQILKKYGELGYCVMHIRRGDYANRKNQTVYCHLKEDYYIEAFEFVKRETGINKVVVVSDDHSVALEYSRKLSEFAEVLSVDYTSDSMRDFFIIMEAKAVIIANSTYSLSAAILNENSPIIVSPKTWFLDDIENNKINYEIVTNVKNVVTI